MFRQHVGLRMEMLLHNDKVSGSIFGLRQRRNQEGNTWKNHCNMCQGSWFPEVLEVHVDGQPEVHHLDEGLLLDAGEGEVQGSPQHLHTKFRENLCFSAKIKWFGLVIMIVFAKVCKLIVCGVSTFVRQMRIFRQNTDGWDIPLHATYPSDCGRYFVRQLL